MSASIVTGAKWDAESGIVSVTMSRGSFELRLNGHEALAAGMKICRLLGKQMTEEELREAIRS